jgi:hypothetical protein
MNLVQIKKQTSFTFENKKIDYLLILPLNFGACDTLKKKRYATVNRGNKLLDY